MVNIPREWVWNGRFSGQPIPHHEHNVLNIRDLPIFEYGAHYWKCIVQIQMDRNTMKALVPIVALCTFASVLMNGQLFAQTAPTPIDQEVEQRIWQDQVSADYSTPANKETLSPFLRTTEKMNDGLYRTVVTDAYGTIRMTGSYLDRELTVADGSFSFYYANGAPESEGEFVKGMKSGKWACWYSDGTPRADRFYNGMNWDDLQVSLGLSERAAMLGPERLAGNMK